MKYPLTFRLTERREVVIRPSSMEPNILYAFDAKTGRIIGSYDRDIYEKNFEAEKST